MRMSRDSSQTRHAIAPSPARVDHGRRRASTTDARARGRVAVDDRVMDAHARDAGDASSSTRGMTMPTTGRWCCARVDDSSARMRTRRRGRRRGVTMGVAIVVVVAVMCAGVRGSAVRKGRGGTGGDDATPAAYEFVDEDVDDRFGSMSEDVLRKILESSVDDDPDDMAWADADEDEDMDAIEDEYENAAATGAATGTRRGFARLGSGGASAKELRKIKRMRARVNRGAATVEGGGGDPEEALRRARDALEEATIEDAEEAGMDDVELEADLGVKPVVATSKPTTVRQRNNAGGRPGTRRQQARGGFPTHVSGSTSSSRDTRERDAETRRPGWTLMFSDDFDGGALDLTKWRPKLNQSAPGLERHGGQQQFYTPEMCKVVDGVLVMATRRQENVKTPATPGADRGDGSKYPFLSCWVDTKHAFKQLYGRMEIRAKLPDPKCPGIWPQHWMLPDPEKTVPKHACWPLGGQIDIMQSYGRGRGGPGTRPGTVESGYHFAPKAECGAEGYARSAFPPFLEQPIDFSTDFHTFAVEWSKESLTFFVDDHPVHHISRFNVPIIPRWPFYLILNTAVSPFGMPAALNECDGDMFHYVDYVRVYKKTSATLSPDVWRFLVFSFVVLTTFITISVCTLRRAFQNDGGRFDEYAALDTDDEVDPLAFDEHLYVTREDDFGVVRKPVKPFSYSIDDDDGSSLSRRRGSSASTPLIGGDVVLALPDDGTGRFRTSGPYIRRRANPPKSSRPGVVADVWARDDEY